MSGIQIIRKWYYLYSFEFSYSVQLGVSYAMLFLVRNGGFPPCRQTLRLSFIYKEKMGGLFVKDKIWSSFHNKNKVVFHLPRNWGQLSIWVLMYSCQVTWLTFTEYFIKYSRVVGLEMWYYMKGQKVYQQRLKIFLLKWKLKLIPISKLYSLTKIWYLLLHRR